MVRCTIRFVRLYRKGIYEIHQRKALTALSPLSALVLFLCSASISPLAQYVSNSVASANSYYWTLFGLEGLYAVFTGFLVYRFSKKAQFKLGKNPLQALIEAVFCGLFGLLVGLLHQWFCPRTGSRFESISSGN